MFSVVFRACWFTHVRCSFIITFSCSVHLLLSVFFSFFLSFLLTLLLVLSCLLRVCDGDYRFGDIDDEPGLDCDFMVQDETNQLFEDRFHNPEDSVFRREGIESIQLRDRDQPNPEAVVVVRESIAVSDGMW